MGGLGTGASGENHKGDQSMARSRIVFRVCDCTPNATDSHINRISRFLSVTFSFLIIFLFPAQSFAKEPTQIQKLKKFYINTMLVQNGIPYAVIVAPHGNQYRESVNVIRDKGAYRSQHPLLYG